MTRRQRLGTLTVLWAFALVVLVVFRSVVMPFAGAALIAYLVAPLVEKLRSVRFGKRRLPHWAAILVIYAVFFLGVYLMFIALVPQLYRELSRISREAFAWTQSLSPERIRELANHGEAWLRDRGFPVALSSRALEGPDAHDAPALSFDLEVLIKAAVTKGQSAVQESFGDLVALSKSVVTAVLASVFMLFFVLMVAAFFSIDSRGIATYVKTLIPPEYADDVGVLVRRIDRSLAGVVRGQFTICLVNGFLTFVGLVLFGVKFAFLLATVATVLSLIPIFGSIISSVPIVAIGLSQGWKTGLAALAWIVGIHALEAYFLNPKIMGTAARIHPVVVAFSLIAGERYFGLTGALFAVPVAAVIVACFDFARQKAQPAPLPTSER